MRINTRYNGWVNYETWVVNLWLTIDEDTSKQLDNIIKNFITPQRRSDKLRDMVQGLMYDFTDNVYEFGASIHGGLFIDLLKAGFENVKWDEIIDHHKHDFD